MYNQISHKFLIFLICIILFSLFRYNISFTTPRCSISFHYKSRIMNSNQNEEINVEIHHPRWQQLWEQGISPGTSFDKCEPSPALVKYVIDNKIPTGRCLVPGCGRGYDVNLLALNSDRHVYGIDISQTAVNEAITWYTNLDSSKQAKKEFVHFELQNFFHLSESKEEKFDFIYDYTFLCALNPSIRSLWAQKMRNLLSDNGRLLTLIYPIRSLDITTGPPFTVSLDIVKDLLEEQGFESIELHLLPKELCHPQRNGEDGFPNSGIGLWKIKQ